MFGRLARIVLSCSIAAPISCSLRGALRGPGTERRTFLGCKNVNFQGSVFRNEVYASGWMILDAEKSQKRRAQGRQRNAWKKNAFGMMRGLFCANRSLIL